MIIKEMYDQGAINCPKWMPNNTHYVTIMGSIAYGCNKDTSDFDCYGFCMPPKEMIFPHLNGEIYGFGRQIHKFEQYQEAHLLNKSQNREYDFSIYSIVKYFQLCMENNPNMVDSLMTPQNCVLHCTDIGQMVRDNRKMFIHKGCYHKFKGYAYSQKNKILNKSNSTNEKRAKDIKEHGNDTKFMYHLVRLMLECEQLLTYGEMDIQRDREIYKNIRAGEWDLQKVEEFFTMKEKYLEQLYQDSKLPHSPDEEKIKELLLNCIEQHYGTVSTYVTRNDNTENLIKDLETVIEKYK